MENEKSIIIYDKKNSYDCGVIENNNEKILFSFGCGSIKSNYDKNLVQNFILNPELDKVKDIIFKDDNNNIISKYNYSEYVEKYPKLFIIRKQYNFTKPFIVDLNVTEDIVELKYLRRFYLTESNSFFEYELFNCYLNRFELMKRKDWWDNSKFSVHLKTWDIDAILMRNRILEDLVLKNNITDKEKIDKILNIHAGRKGTVNRNGYLVNISALLQNGRIPSTEDHAFFPGHRIFNFFLKFKDSKFTEMFLSIPIDPETIIEHNCRGIAMYNSTELKTKWKNNEEIQNRVWQPDFKIKTQSTTINHKDHAKIQVQLINSYTKEPIKKSCDVFLENINGYLPKNRITLDNNGYGEFKFYPLYLSKGDNMKVKVGFRYFPAKQELTFNII